MRMTIAIMTTCATVAAAGSAGAADTGTYSGTTLFGRTSASVTFGPYLRFEVGRAGTDLANGNWLPPGASDPRVFFDIGDDDSTFAGAAVGFDWMNGFRADLGVISLGEVDAIGPWSYTIPNDPGPHADITNARVRTTALMGSVFYSPLEQRGVNSRIQPYFVAGLGFANNRMSEWTRFRASASTPVRTFQGNSSIDLAYSLGVGVAVQVTRPGQHPVIMDLSWRYYDFGTAKGGTASVVGAGGTPREAYNVDRRDSVISLGVRIPLRRY
jgi:hypothetical protein